MAFVCSNCDAQYPKWQGRCNECGKWSTIGELQQTKSLNLAKTGKKSELDTNSIVDIRSVEYSKNYRFPAGLVEVDNVFGGGLVQGSLTLLGGAPGVG